MGDWTSLLGLQRLDTSADQLRHRRGHLPERVALEASEVRLASVQAELAELTTEVQGLAKRQRQLEHEITDLEAKEAEVGRRLSRGTVPREVQALAQELDNLRHRRSGLEDEVLEVMETVEPLQARSDTLVAAVAEMDEELATARVLTAEAEVRVETELADATAARAELAASIDADLLAEYDRLRPRLGGVAVAELVNGHCSGCNLLLPASELDRIRHLSADARVICEDCGRLLVHG